MTYASLKNIAEGDLESPLGYQSRTSNGIGLSEPTI